MEEVHGDGYPGRAHDRLDDHPAQRIPGVLSRVARVRGHQEQRLADDRRRQAAQRRRDQVAAVRRAEGAEAYPAGDGPAEDEVGRGRGHGKEAGERQAAHVGVAEHPGLAGRGHPGQPRHQRKRDRRRGQRDRQEVEVRRQLESHHAAGHPVGGERQRPEQQSCQRGLGQRGQGPADRGTHLGVVPSGFRHEGDANPSGAPPLHARMQHDGAGGAQAEQEHQGERDALLRRHMGVEDGHHPEDGDRAQILDGGRGGREREAAVGVHDRRCRAHDRVQRHLRQQEQHQHRADVHLAAGSRAVGGAGRAQPEQPGGGDRRRAERSPACPASPSRAARQRYARPLACPRSRCGRQERARAAMRTSTRPAGRRTPGSAGSW